MWPTAWPAGYNAGMSDTDPPRVLLDICDGWSPDLMDVVGQIAVAFGQLEWVVYLSAKRKSTKALREFRKEKENRTDKFGTWCCRLLERYPDDNKLSSLINRALIAGKARNDVIHAVWGKDLSDQRLGRWRPSGNLGIEIEPLRVLLRSVREIRDELNEYTNAKKKAPQAS